MDNTRHKYSLNLVFGKFHLRGYGTGKIGCTSLMTSSIGIPHFNCYCHGMYDFLHNLSKLLGALFKFLLRPLMLDNFCPESGCFLLYLFFEFFVELFQFVLCLCQFKVFLNSGFIGTEKKVEDLRTFRGNTIVLPPPRRHLFPLRLLPLFPYATPYL